MPDALSACGTLAAADAVYLDVAGRRALIASMALAVMALVAILFFTLPRHGELHRLVCLGPDGRRCDGPLPIDSLHVDRAGTRLSGVFICGGWLSAAEDGNQVTVTYLAPYVGPGVRQCAAPTLAVRLHSPIGRRPVLDGVTHHAIAISR